VTAGINGCRHVLVRLRIGGFDGIACRSVADFLLTTFSFAPWVSVDERELLCAAKDSTETAGTSCGGAARTSRGTWFDAG
jgi:hypothetical protein